MKISENILIDPKKLTHYLLVFRKRNDKSKWLAKAGYTLENWKTLDIDLRKLFLSNSIVMLESTPFGQVFEVSGTLLGPNGKNLLVKSIWMTEHETEITKFITVIPGRERKV